MARARTSRGSRRLVAGLAFAALTAVTPVGLASAAGDDGDQEAYPPAPTQATVTPTTQQIPKTGNDGTDTWVKVGAGALMVGGVLVAAASRRRRDAAA